MYHSYKSASHSENWTEHTNYVQDTFIHCNLTIHCSEKKDTDLF